MRHPFFLLIVSICCLLFGFSCKNKQNKESILVDTLKDQQILSECLVAATTGAISSNDKIVYILKTSINDDLTPDDLQSLIQISPQVDGVVKLSNKSFIEFTPTNRLKSNTEYQITLYLKKIGACSENFTYKIKTFEQDILVSKNGLRITQQGESILLLEVTTADKETTENIAKCFDSDADDILVEEISPTKFAVEVTWNNPWTEKSHVNYNARPIGSKKNGNIELFDIRANEFAILFTKYDFNNKIFNTYFSRPLRTTTDLTGLISANNKDVKYIIKDSQLSIYLSEFRNDQEVELKILPSIYSIYQDTLSNSYSFNIKNDIDKPAVEFLQEGNYFPSEGDFKIPIKTRALEKVRLTVVEIKKNNRRHLMTWQSLDNSNYDRLKMYGKPIYDEVLELQAGITSTEGWKIYGLDLSEHIARNAGSIYNISLSFEPSHSSLSCKSDLIKKRIPSKIPDEQFWTTNNYGQYGYYNEYYNGFYYDNYDWKDRHDPCKLSYYRNVEPSRKFLLCSDIGYIVKKADREIQVSLSELKTTKPIINAEVSLINLQGEIIVSKKSSKNGFASFKNIPFNASLVEVDNNQQIVHIPLNPGRSNSLTEFDISGNRSEKDQKFFLYTDRDVWRPGDSIFLDIMVNSESALFADGLPIKLSFYNNSNILIDEQVQSFNLSDHQIYSFKLATDRSAKSGRYYCVLDIGPFSLRKKLNIENIRPNTAEIIYDFVNEENKIIYDNKFEAHIKAQYLNGFVAKNAKINAKAHVSLINSPFPKYKEYDFKFENIKSESISLFAQSVNQDGEKSIESNYDFSSFNGPIQLSIETEINWFIVLTDTSIYNF